MYLIWLGLRLFVLECRITFAQKLVDWRAGHVKNFSDPLLCRLARKHSRLSTKFMRLEGKFKERAKREK